MSTVDRELPLDAELLRVAVVLHERAVARGDCWTPEQEVARDARFAYQPERLARIKAAVTPCPELHYSDARHVLGFAAVTDPNALEYYDSVSADALRAARQEYVKGEL